ncbi:MAG: hypothetical protein CMJ18_05425 [Phycisphaeraceae bacterium]|nr:hypothetical protein [Phycisphaeraceae bacterium]
MRRPAHLRLGCIATLAMSLPTGAALAEADGARVAMLDFTSNDVVYASWVNAASFSAAVQAELIDIEGVDWIERQQLALARSELDLAPLQLAGAGALRVGRWVTADLVVLGRFRRPGQRRHELALDIVDMRRADILDSTVIDIGDTDIVRVEPDDVSATATWLREALSKARRTLAETRDQRCIAPLFFRNVGPTDRLDYLEGRIGEALSKASETRPRVRTLRLLGAGAAGSEAEMVVLGLIDADADAWSRVADLYIWGTYQEAESKDGAFRDVEIEIELNFWNGRDEIEKAEHRCRVAEVPALLEELGADACAIAGRRRAEVAGSEVRKQVAKTLMDQDLRVRIQMAQSRRGSREYHRSKIGRAHHRYRVGIVEAAHFFAPDDPEIRLRLLRTRWGSDRPPDPRPAIVQLMKMAEDYERIGTIESGAR